MFPSHLFAVAALASAAFLGGCATVIDPAKVTPVDGSARLTLPAPFTYAWQLGGLCSARIQYTLAAGRYVARFRNESGTFFEGTPAALATQVVANDCTQASIGQGLKIGAGIFVPDAAREPARIYFTQPPHGTYDITVTSLASGTDDSGAVAGPGGTITVAAPPNASPVAAGVGAGIGAGIVSGLIAADQGKIRILPGQKGDALARAIVRN